MSPWRCPHNAPPPAVPMQGERSAAATLAAWQQYRHACELRLLHDPPAPGERSGVWGGDTMGTPL